MTIRISAFPWVPDFAQGYVKDLRVRWALEEAGLAYEVDLIDPDTRKSARYLAWQPFGQVPAYRDDRVELFESGAIVLHIAARSPALAPAGEAGLARVSTWVVAALNSVEPFARHAAEADGFPEGNSWAQDRKAEIDTALHTRLAALAAWLGDKDYLENRFTAGDLVMATVLREVVESGALAYFPALEKYLERCLARPAFGRALEAQMQVFRANAPG